MPAKTKQEQPNQETQSVVDVTPKDEDSVKQDLGRLKIIIKKLTGQAGSRVKPHAEKVKSKTQTAGFKQAKEKGNKFMSSFTKIAIFIVIVFVTILLIAIAFTIFNKFKATEDGGNGKLTREEVVFPTPSTFIYKPSKPSIYASDLLILKIEEDAKILEGEMFSTQIRESTLYPPSLDFNINFGDK